MELINAKPLFPNPEVRTPSELARFFKALAYSPEDAGAAHFGRLLDVLADKGVLNAADISHIICDDADAYVEYKPTGPRADAGRAL